MATSRGISPFAASLERSAVQLGATPTLEQWRHAGAFLSSGYRLTAGSSARPTTQKRRCARPALTDSRSAGSYLRPANDVMLVSPS